MKAWLGHHAACVAQSAVAILPVASQSHLRSDNGQIGESWGLCCQSHASGSGRPPTPSDLYKVPIRFRRHQLNPHCHHLLYYVTDKVSQARKHIGQDTRGPSKLQINVLPPLMEVQSTASFSGRQLHADVLPQALHHRWNQSCKAPRKGVKIQARRLLMPLPEVHCGNAEDSSQLIKHAGSINGRRNGPIQEARTCASREGSRRLGKGIQGHQ